MSSVIRYNATLCNIAHVDRWCQQKNRVHVHRARRLSYTRMFFKNGVYMKRRACLLHDVYIDGFTTHILTQDNTKYHIHLIQRIHIHEHHSGIPLLCRGGTCKKENILSSRILISIPCILTSCPLQLID